MMHTDLNDLDRMRRLVDEHPDWSWMKWESEWQRTGDEDMFAIAISKMMEERAWA